MSYLALYRKYRPSSFDDMVGQNDVSKIIKNEILNNKISHAYLFSGPRGTGKTSTAKIIAKMVNCLNLSEDGMPCGVCQSCINVNNNDVVEIDAASNNGVDEIRDLRDKVNLVPTSGKYKIYIIDEVHMLTTQAFNALLKTLEEPPSHAIFILATTEFYKIPATVVSRCQKFQFLKFSNEEIVSRLSKIASLEKIPIRNDVLYEIARLSDGGLRDAINMLDQLSSFKNGEVNIEDVYKLNGVISYNEMADLLLFVYNNKVTGIIEFLNNIDKSGKNISKFITDLINFLKDVLIFKNISNFNSNIKEKNKRIEEISNIFSVDNTYDMIISLNDLANRIKNSNFSFILLVTYFIKQANDFHQQLNNSIKLVDLNSNLKKEFTVVNDASSNLEVQGEKIKINIINNNIKKIRINNSFATASKKNKDEFISKWINIDQFINKIDYGSIIGIINDIDVLVVGDNNVIFLVKYDSLLDRIYNYIDDFEKLLLQVFNVSYKIVFLANDEWLYEKNNYIKSIKSGKKYEYIPEEEYVFDSLKTKEVNNVNKTSSDIDKLVSILGEDVISYK